MKRKAVLIGNTAGLEGVKIDINQFNTFLLSTKGGAWNSSEIEILLNPSKNSLLARLSSIRQDQYDYSIVMFSGHGGQTRETVLEINDHSETVSENQLQNLSTRQLNIYDCCRCYLETFEKAAQDRMKIASFTESNRDRVRRIYDARIMQAITQQAALYSCSIGEKSYDTPNGAVYLGNLLKSACNISDQYKLVGVAHQEAIEPTFLHSLSQGHGNERQTPSAVLPKCVSAQQLIISINPLL